ncbi:MAG TPA: cation diffusion facilitator family transporter [Limnobacter sp.]|uniref:cation diffusion facilitator family transporter n=1 Tax=Limnobacter sp. TaxID=2003368 RepID=UPI002ED7AAEB
MPGCTHCHDDDHAHNNTHPANRSPAYRRVLWVALIVNAGMFVFEIASGLKADSASLLADSLDFLGDAANYAVSLFVLGMALQVRARAALVKGLTLGAFGVGVLGVTAYNALTGQSPQPWTMGVVSVAALFANVLVALLLYRWRDGDANMHSVWLCSRNDAIGNIAVFLAAVAVQFTGQSWPDWAVAVLMALLGLSAARTIVKRALGELASAAPQSTTGQTPRPKTESPAHTPSPHPGGGQHTATHASPPAQPPRPHPSHHPAGGHS